ncbi:MAG: HDIG domain-containing protein [Clostridia bacterium]|nr:HDIG domain-containing protein [Clostridia bacterium]
MSKQNRGPAFDGRIPEPVLRAMRALRESGYAAYLVGGCVRDLLSGLSPHDYDLTTSAFPDETEAVFKDFRVVETGIKHGTVTVLSDGMPLEITTFRTDGVYSDGRHPDKVTFTRSLEDDLSRRDFTVNAMAWSPEKGLVDLFGGEEDLKNGILRCVGDPEKRFTEDALRILRLCRFASVLGMEPERETADTALRLRDRLNAVSAERIYAECTKLLCGKNVFHVLMEFHPVLCVFIPELADCVAFPQASPYHCYDVYTHTAHVVAGVRPDPVLRWAALLHDVAKPECFAFRDGRATFHGHPERGARMAETILTRLRADKKTTAAVSRLVRDHDRGLPETRKGLLRLMADHPEEEAIALTELMEADGNAKSEAGRQTLPAIRALKETIERMRAEEPCLTVADLAVSGEDLLGCGFRPGKELGDCLRDLLDGVQEDRIPNRKDDLLTAATEWLAQRNTND